MSTTIHNVQQALLEAELAQRHWIDGGYEALSNQLEEELRKGKQVVDIYPYVELDISVDITIVLPDKVYRVPLEDVSAISVNDCLVISKEDLYYDWEERVNRKLAWDKTIYSHSSYSSDNKFSVKKFFGDDHKVRILKRKLV